MAKPTFSPTYQLFIERVLNHANLFNDDNTFKDDFSPKEIFPAKRKGVPLKNRCNFSPV